MPTEIELDSPTIQEINATIHMQPFTSYGDHEGAAFWRRFKWGQPIINGSIIAWHHIVCGRIYSPYLLSVIAGKRRLPPLVRYFVIPEADETLGRKNRGTSFRSCGYIGVQLFVVCVSIQMATRVTRINQ